VSAHDGASEVRSVNAAIGGIETLGSRLGSSVVVMVSLLEASGESLLESSLLEAAGEASLLDDASLLEASGESSDLLDATEAHGLVGHDGGGLHVGRCAVHDGASEAASLDDALLESTELGSGLDDRATVEAAIHHAVSSIEGGSRALSTEAGHTAEATDGATEAGDGG
jgi:hypothetical protein